MYKEIIDFIQTEYNTQDTIPLHEPLIDQSELEIVSDTIKSTFVSTVGNNIQKFEELVCQKVKAKYAVAVSSGTAALHLSLRALNINNEHEVITQPLSFIATSNSIKYVNSNPIFIDINPITLSLDPSKLEEFLKTETIMDKNNNCINKKTKKTIKACIVMHTFGFPALMDEINSICKKYNILVVEDAAQSFGSKYHQTYTGLLSEVGVFSFNGNKVITTGSGGVVVSNNKTLIDSIRHLSSTAKIDTPFYHDHDMIGYNYRMSNIHAAIGISQINKFEKILKEKRALANRYKEFFQQFDDIKFVIEPKGTYSNYWLNTILVSQKSNHQILLEELNNNKILARGAWKLHNTTHIYKGYQHGNLEHSYQLSQQIINLPSSIKEIG